MAVLNKYHHSNTCPAGSINIMRGSIFGNPYRIGVNGGREAVVKQFENYLRKRLQDDLVFKEKVRGLHGKDLCCCCAPQACHGDVLEKVAAELHAEREAEKLADLEALFGPFDNELKYLLED